MEEYRPRRKAALVLAHFSTATTHQNPRGTYNVIGLKEMLKNPPPAFADSDREPVQRALDRAPAPKR